MIKRWSNQGFTLFELLVVITIAGFVFSVMAYLYTGFVKNKLYEAKRSSIFNQQMLTQEYLSRYIKNALPSTLDVSNDKQCVQFMSVLGSGIFLSMPVNYDDLLKKVSLDENAQKNSQEIRYLMPLNKPKEDLGKLTPVFSVSESIIGVDLQSDSVFDTAFILLSGAKRFCLHDKQLLFYKNTNFSDYLLITEHVFSDQPFALKEESPSFSQLYVNLNFGDDVLSLRSDYIITTDYEY